MRVGRFFITETRKPRRIVKLHGRSLDIGEDSVVLYDPAYLEREGRSVTEYWAGWADAIMEWIDARRDADDPPAVEILTKLWPGDKKLLDEALNYMAARALMGGDSDRQATQGD